MPARKPKADEKPQSERFIQTAREIGADETPDAFERVFKRVAFRQVSAEKDRTQASPRIVRKAEPSA